jgi:hypothetical protein
MNVVDVLAILPYYVSLFLMGDESKPVSLPTTTTPSPEVVFTNKFNGALILREN